MSVEISHAKKNVDNYLISITFAWNKAAMSILEVGRQLIEAQNDLSKIEFRQLKKRIRRSKDNVKKHYHKIKKNS